MYWFASFQVTFFHLYKCAEEEKSKVIRVLNLWQKNEVFVSEVIQPLFDLANPNSELSKQMEDQFAKTGAVTATSVPSSSVPSDKKSSDGAPTDGDPHIQQQIQTIHQLLRQTSEVKFNKKVLEFDYSDDEADGGPECDSVAPTAAMLDALQSLMANEAQLEQLKAYGGISSHQIAQLKQLLPGAQMSLNSQQQQNSFGSGGVGSAGSAGQANQPPPFNSSSYTSLAGGGDSWGQPMQAPPAPSIGEVGDDDIVSTGGGDDGGNDIEIVDDFRGKRGSSSRRSRSRSRSPSSRARGSSRKGGSSRRSRSRSYERRSSRRRSRSRSPREREADREKRREREKKGLPPIKKGHLSGTCPATTLL